MTKILYRDPGSLKFSWEEKVFIGSPCSKHVPNGMQNDIRGGLLEAKWFPGMAFGVFGGSWVSIGLPGESRRDFSLIWGFL